MEGLETLKMVHAVTKAIAGAACFDEVCRIAIDAVLASLRADRASLLLVDEQGVMQFRAWSGLSEEYRRHTTGHSPWSPDDPAPEVVTIPDVARHEGLGALREVVLAEGLGALAFVPLSSGRRLLGKFMVYFDRPHDFGEDELCVARIVGEQLGFALARFRAEDRAHEVGEELRAVLDAVVDGVLVQEPSGKLRYANDAAARVIGLASGVEMVRLSASQLLAPYRLCTEDGAPYAFEDLPSRRAMSGERTTGVVGFEPVDGGEVRWVRSACEPCRDAEGNVRFAVTVMQDITEARRAADARRFLLEVGDMLSASLDVEATLSAVAKLAVPRLADWCAVELIQDDGSVQSVAIEHRDPAKIAFARRLLTEYPAPRDTPGSASSVARTGQPQLTVLPPELLETIAQDEEHLRLLRAVALRTALVVPLTAHGRVLGIVNLAQAESNRSFHDRDLATARQLGERAGVALENARLFTGLRAAQETLELAMEAGRMGHWEYVVDTGRVWWSPAVAALHGIAPEAFDGTFAGFLRDILPEDVGGVMSSLADATAHGERLDMEYRIRRPDGSVRWVEGRGRVYRTDDGRVQRLAGFCMDISDRKQAELALDAERKRLSVTLASIGDAVIATNCTGEVTLMNGVAESLTGWTSAEARGRPLLDVFPIFSARTGLPIPNPVEEVLRTGRIVGLANHTVLLSRDGTRRSIADSAAPIRDEGSGCAGVVLVFRDVTQQERLEREMAKASKLESIGVLAGGIAHDFNNILTAITANVSLAEHRLVAGHPAQSRLAAALAASERARDITRQLLTFSQGGAPVKAATSLSDVLREACGFALQGSNVRAQFTFGDDLDAIDADAGQISQVAHNLVLNAAQAMPHGGRLAVAAENVVVDAPSWLPLSPGRYVRFTVTDEGPGIPAEAIAQIFDPFYTTKRDGTGLGLATSFSIVHRHGGHIGVESPRGGGAVFTVHLPASAGAPAPLPVPGAKPVGKGRVLVMDDDPAILALVGECLRELGYEPDFAADGAVAIERYTQARAAGVAHDLLIMDLTVPGGMGGRETLLRLRQTFPEVRAVVSSGYSHDPVIARYREHGFVDALRKPYALDELARVLRDAFAAMV